MALFSRKNASLDSLSFDPPKPFLSLQLQSTFFSLLISALFMLLYNNAFFHALTEALDVHSLRGALFAASITFLVSIVMFIIMTLMTLPYLSHILMAILFIGAAAAAYFMNAYGIVIHRTMIQNMMETDAKETFALLNPTLGFYLVFLGLIPAVALTRIRIQYGSFFKELWYKARNIAIALLIAGAMIASMSADYASFFRNNKSVREMVNPLNFIYAGFTYFSNTHKPKIIKPIGEDAQLNQLGKSLQKPTLFILVVGETARADHFSINGYHRDTTPLIAQQAIVNYSRVFSCGTETAVSVPCMFSNLGRDDYSDKKAKSQEGLLDIVKRSGFNVLWRDNNSGCKGTCDRVTYEDMAQLKVPELCNDQECFDNILLHELDAKTAAMKGNKLIVLHQKGSHGPDYFHRVPEKDSKFTPVCRVNKLQDCSSEEINNAFDNTISYTDQFLNNTIEWLKKRSDNYNTALIYLSDHGESLGEKNLYLHGMPYVVAPVAQKHIPFFMWFSPNFEQDNRINRDCLNAAKDKEFSHDNLFHTVLGLLNIETSLYKTELDMTADCRQTITP